MKAKQKARIFLALAYACESAGWKLANLADYFSRQAELLSGKPNPDTWEA